MRNSLLSIEDALAENVNQQLRSLSFCFKDFLLRRCVSVNHLIGALMSASNQNVVTSLQLPQTGLKKKILILSFWNLTFFFSIFVENRYFSICELKVVENHYHCSQCHECYDNSYFHCKNCSKCSKIENSFFCATCDNQILLKPVTDENFEELEQTFENDTYTDTDDNDEPMWFSNA